MTIRSLRWTTLAVCLMTAFGAMAATHPLRCHARHEPDARACRRALAALIPAVGIAGHHAKHWPLAQRMRHYRVPGISIAFVDRGKVAWRSTAGNRDATRPVTAQTVFQAASISKPLAATLALMLVQAHRLDLDAGVNTQLHGWELPAGGAWDANAVTLRGLLSHSAGINVHGFPGYAAGVPLPDELQILDGKPPANSPPIRLIQAPGKRYRYSGGGYQIAQRMIEDAGDGSFEHLAQQRLLAPLHMHYSAYSADLPPHFAGNVAEGHAYDGNAVPGGWHRYPELAAAALWSTPDDLARYLLALMAAWHGHTSGPLTPRIAHLMMTPAIENMGLGLGVHGDGKRRLVDQAGSTVGFRTYLAAYPERSQGVVVMSNGDGGKDLIEEICRSLARQYHWPDFQPQRIRVARIDPAVLDARAGRYRIAEFGFTLTLRRHGRTLVANTPRGSRYTFLALSPLRFVAIEDGATLEFDAHAPDQIRLWGMHGTRLPANPSAPRAHPPVP